ncbi:hypothetical protein IFM89_024213 [Coptis chinensis]|uniref:Uncharacterized protein n=1 Tax=Coptis chinensis TaxID=261450 RepID=A0A835H635_9MAGN|nr:hypothetical protein IFM89_024213 [Coptis chinensis]
MIDEASTSQAASKNADRRTRRSISRLVEEVEEIQEEKVSLKDLLRRMAELEKQNKMLMAENKAIREEKEKRAEDVMYEKDDEESSLGTPVVRKSHLEEVRRSHLEEVNKILFLAAMRVQVNKIMFLAARLSSVQRIMFFAARRVQLKKPSLGSNANK